MITGVVLARNEERNIVDCLQSFRPHVAELLVIDMESTDRTVELARAHADRVLSHPLTGNFDAARNMAIPEARFDWLWFVDADERVPPRTGRLVNELVRDRGEEITAVTIPFKSYFCGKWIEHCGWWPGYTMPRVLKRGHFRFADRLHGGVEFHGREVRVPPDPDLAIEHFSYRSIEQYVEKFNRYTTTEARYLAEQGEQGDWRSPVRAMMHDLWLYYEQNQGHLDGDHGWILSWLAGQYRWFSRAKLLDLRNGSSMPSPRESVPASLDAVIHLMESELAALRSGSPQLPLGIVWRSPIWDPSGYADESRVVLTSLADQERPLTIEEIRWSDRTCRLPGAYTTLLTALTRCKRPPFVAAITSCIPSFPQCGPDPCAALNVLRTTFETDRIPSDWLPKIETFHEVWVPCKHNELAFRRAGVPPEKIRILPQYVDTSLFTSRGRKLALPEPLSGRFVFLSVFDWQLRKGWDVLLKAYSTEFSADDGAALLLKITTAHGQTMDSIRRQADAVLEPLSQFLEGRADIVFWHEMLEAEDLAALYRSADAFVLASRGEGWGRPYMEAMASGLPTIGTRGSGNDDFMNDENSLLVSTTLVDVPDAAAEEIPVYRGHRWLEPDVGELRAAMRQVLSEKRKRKTVSRRAISDMRSRFSLAHAREAVEENLCAAEERFRADPPPEVRQSQVRVELEGEFFAGHSFSNINEKLALRFMRNPSLALSLRRVRHNPTHDDQSLHAHRLRPYMERSFAEGPHVTIRHAFPPTWEPPQRGHWVHIQPWEFGALPIEWVKPLRDQVDEIWAPSAYVKNVYQRSGIPIDKIRVIPWGVEPDVFRPDAPPLLLPAERLFRFLFVGGTIPRKGFDLVFEAYLAEFSKDDDVCLVVKDVGTTSFYRYGNYRQRVLETVASGQAPAIVYNDQNMTEGQLASLYTACNCLVAPYRGEGFGLPILESMACGLPAIVPRGGASDDFVTEATAYMLPAEEVECEHDWRLCGVPTELSIHVKDVRNAMRRAYEDHEETARKGKRASKHVRDRFTWDRTARFMAERIERLSRDSQPPATTLSGKQQVAAAQTPTITLCMLSHNSAKTIADSLGRIRPIVTEAVVLDLGSDDRTREVALEYGARVYQDVPSDNLSALRNAAIRRATGEWVLVLDADEWIHEREAQKLLGLLESVGDEVLGVRISVRSQHDTSNQKSPGMDVRAFRNHNDIVFDFRACEQVEPSIVRLGGEIVESDIEVVRAPETEGRNGYFRCAEKLRRLLHLDLAERPGDPAVLFNLGTTHYRLGNSFHAECYLNDCLRQSDPNANHYGIAARRLIDCHVKKGDTQRAREVAEYAGQRLRSDEETPSQFPGPVRTAGDQTLRLYLGAGHKRLNGYVHVDIEAGSGIDVPYDLNQTPWPWEDDSAEIIVAEDLVEHLDVHLIRFCDEAWRVLAPGGELFIRTPHREGKSSWIDPTHRWHLDEQAFHYLDPDTQWGQLYPDYTRRKWRILSLGVRGPQNIHAVMAPRK